MKMFGLRVDSVSEGNGRGGFGGPKCQCCGGGAVRSVLYGYKWNKYTERRYIANQNGCGWHWIRPGGNPIAVWSVVVRVRQLKSPKGA